MKAILTGFEPFGSMKNNPAWEAVRRLPDCLTDPVGGERILVKKCRLPVTYRDCFAPLAEAMDAFAPDVVICLGVAAQRTAVTPEVVAINRQNAALPDNEGVIARDRPIVEEGESVLYTGLPLPRVLDAFAGVGLPVRLSFDAGTYVCNTLFYRLMEALRPVGGDACPGIRPAGVPIVTERAKVTAGFLHVPPAAILPPAAVTDGLCALLFSLSRLRPSDFSLGFDSSLEQRKENLKEKS